MEGHAQRRERRIVTRYEPYEVPAKAPIKNVRPQKAQVAKKSQLARPALLTLDIGGSKENESRQRPFTAPTSKTSSSALVPYDANTTTVAPYDPTAKKQKFGGRFASLLQNSGAVAAAEKAQDGKAALTKQGLQRSVGTQFMPLSLVPPRAKSNSSIGKGGGPLLLTAQPSSGKGQAGAVVGVSKGQVSKRGAKKGKGSNGGVLVLVESPKRPNRVALRDQIGDLSDDENEDSVSPQPDRLEMLKRLGKGAPSWSDSVSYKLNVRTHAASHHLTPMSLGCLPLYVLCV